MFHLDGTIFTLQGNGGVSVYTREIAKRLLRASPNSVVAVYDNVAHARSGVNATLASNRILERYRNFAVGPGITLAHSPYYRRPDSPKVPLVTTVHDFIYERHVRGIKRWVHHTQKAAAIHRSQVILCVSESTKADLLYFFPKVDQRRVFVTHLATGSAFHAPPPDNQSSNTYALFVGNRQGYKNFRSAVEAIASLQDYSLYAIGGGPLSQSEKDMVQSRLKGRFHHLTGIDDAALSRLYSNAFCLLYPSTYEGFGIPVVEAMSCGCPVIATRSSSIPEVAGNGGLLVERGDPDELRAAIIHLQSASNRSALIRAGHENVKRFSWDKTFDATMSAYRTVL